MVDDQQVRLQLSDTDGQEHCKKICPLTYRHTYISQICFSLVPPTSLENVQNIWIPEIKEYCPTTPDILGGMQLDPCHQMPTHLNDLHCKKWLHSPYR
jgi:GTPase SAR1 family protein